MIRLLRKLRSLRPAGRVMLLQIVVTLPLTALSVRLLGLQQHPIRACSPGAAVPRPRAGRPEDATLCQRATPHRPYPAAAAPSTGTAFSRSLVLWWLLQREGMEVRLRIGVRARGRRSWPTPGSRHEGRPVNAGPRVHERFVPFDTPFLPKGARLA